MEKNHHSRGSACEIAEKSPQKGGFYEGSPFDHMNAKVDAMYHKIENLSISPTRTYLFYSYIFCFPNGSLLWGLQNKRAYH